ncbi:HD domain-containing phosphohydrolase [Vibrio sp. Hep-1b-8]|uniref:HD domain-containing phosphohydrolase n=1 Tax=Vibrio sp. Hep-1b-8 TaxID=2144187 RepID=UPI001110A9F8|nr:HD domain-containing phosphohydrolase [Vibrio sp. Hep-1b-8]TMX46979.1 phosphohydrolase [Vibrio sp. Hep-1b-8]
MDINLLLNREYLTSHDFYRDLIDFLVVRAKSEIGYLHFFNSGTEEISLNVWSSSVLEGCHSSHETHYPLSAAGIWADSIRMIKPVIHNDYHANYSSPDSLPEGHIQLVHHFSLPILLDKEVVAVVGIGNASFPYQEVFVNEFHLWINGLWPKIRLKTQQIESSSLSNQQVFESHSSYKIMTDMLGAISRALEIRDEYTSSHQRNVAYICSLIATDLSLEEQQREGLVIGALVHDIGKIAIPSQILNKAGKLMPAETALLQNHAQIGSSIFSHVSFPWPILKMIEQHHERLDGSGYPNGLKGSQIVMEARIIAVADTFDAMASDRPYRKALGAQRAIDTLVAGRNTLYDPYVVDSLLRCLEVDATLGGRYTPTQPVISH